MQTAKLNCNEIKCHGLTSTNSSMYSFVDRILLKISQWRDLSMQRRYLSNLSEDQLKDIGLTANDVRRESTKPFWR